MERSGELTEGNLQQGQPPFDSSKVVVLLGPTASGKTQLALELTKQFPFEIVCMDSMQVYREMRIGTARPSDQEEAMVPHHLFGAVSVREEMNCSRFATLASEVMTEIQARGKWVLLVGGTGLYYRALFQGLDPLPSTPNHLREKLNRLRQRHGQNFLYKMLTRLDPRGAASLHPNDAQRTQRFLEVRILSHKSILDYWQHQSLSQPGMDKPLTLGLHVDRSLLIDRIHKRTLAMLQAGWLEETRQLKVDGLFSRVEKVGPIGYLLINAFLLGQISWKDLVDKISIQTRRYAKRQMTWFRKDAHITWFPFCAESGYNVATISDLIGNRMT